MDQPEPEPVRPREEAGTPPKPPYVLSRAAEEYVRRIVAGFDPMDAQTIADMRLIMWGAQPGGTDGG